MNKTRLIAAATAVVLALPGCAQFRGMNWGGAGMSDGQGRSQGASISGAGASKSSPTGIGQIPGYGGAPNY